MNRVRSFIQDVINGYEPALVRSVAVAVFVMLAAFGIGTGNLPVQVEALLTFAAFIVPLVGGVLIRAKVSPVHTIRERTEFGL